MNSDVLHALQLQLVHPLSRTLVCCDMVVLPQTQTASGRVDFELFHWSFLDAASGLEATRDLLRSMMVGKYVRCGPRSVSTLAPRTGSWDGMCFEY